MLRERLGGTWDGGDAECHGLVRRGGVPCKIEVVRSAAADEDTAHVCTVFVGGRAVSSARRTDPVRAVAVALRQMDELP